jgi:hypothetical protein
MSVRKAELLKSLVFASFYPHLALLSPPDKQRVKYHRSKGWKDPPLSVRDAASAVHVHPACPLTVALRCGDRTGRGERSG